MFILFLLTTILMTIGFSCVLFSERAHDFRLIVGAMIGVGTDIVGSYIFATQYGWPGLATMLASILIGIGASYAIQLGRRIQAIWGIAHEVDDG